jgi:hypothetical protein
VGEFQVPKSTPRARAGNRSRTPDSASIENVGRGSYVKISSSIEDNGRRGEPQPGCDCMQCFGRCIVDSETAVRQRALSGDVSYRRSSEPQALDFADEEIVSA